MSMIRIVSAIASTTGKGGITLYLEDMKTLNLPTTNTRTKDVIEDIIRRLARGEIVEIDLDSYSIEATVEKQMGGVVRFARKTRSFIKGLFGASTGNHVAVEKIVLTPADPQKVASRVFNEEAKAFAPHLNPIPVADEPETELVAIVKNQETGKETIIPGVEALSKHMEHAAETKNAIGLQRFMERLAGIIDKRSHTIAELMRFMERGDLPLADDGCIIAYKVLQSTGEPGVWVDCHSQSVKQRLGSFVAQSESLIDPNRRNECSTGLHIARRAYLAQFSGDVITIVKVAPEDVVAVPNYDANKMRAAGYHIVGIIPPEVHSVLRSNAPMTSNETAAKLLADVIAGNHIGMVERVQINAAMGGSITITPLDGSMKAPSPEGSHGLAKAIDDIASVEPQKIDPVQVRKMAEAEREKLVTDVVSDIQQAAATGDMSAAISAPAAAPEPVSPIMREQLDPTYRDSEQPEPAPKESRMQAVMEAGEKILDQKLGKGTAKPTPARVAKAKKVVEKAKADVSALVDIAAKALPEKHQNALRLHGEGKSNRAIEAELKICRKTLKKLFDKHGLKPNG